MIVTIVGGGMITHDQLLPSLYHLQRLDSIGEIWISARHPETLRTLAAAPRWDQAFPGQSFQALPGGFRDAIRKMPKDNLVVVATPDPTHYEIVKSALEMDQHVLCVKPLVLKHSEAVEIGKLARSRGLFVGIEYHKRFDRRALDARGAYRQGLFGEFRCGEAKLVEPWYYRNSNFQTWFTSSDPFTYVGCHYVDLVCFITGLKPVQVSVSGVEGALPNGSKAYLWSLARVGFENGAELGVLNGLGYPDEGAGSNDQGMCLFCEGPKGGAQIKHDDQNRGVTHSYAGGPFKFVSPDYFRLVPWEGAGLRPVGYGYDSVEAIVRSAHRVRDAGKGRAAVLEDIDAKGLVATPQNSFTNELVIEAGRISILDGSRPVRISYRPRPRVEEKR